ncbi:MAG: Rne/Rng family ribonuclease [Acidobacteriia bacterium]|nr:Rne/Rng family ribonuclease [Terriglobia bacterium]
MSKELYVSLTPHETKVAVSEDDQLAEIYFERENEYTLAGSIYKGRVTRVLPGMQSAFVEIGLERDAFLYVSDFFEMEDEQDEFEPVKVGGQRPELRQPAEERQIQPHLIEPESEPQPRAPSPIVFEGPEAPPASAEPAASGTEEGEAGSGWRGRGGRRRRGRRGRALPESKFAHGEQEEAPRGEEREESYAPPPGYPAIVLPGESLSKFSQASPAQPQQVLPGESIAKFSQPQPSQAEPAEEEASRGQERSFERDRRPPRGFDRGRGRDRDQGYGPPPGFQPIILPGESISKYSQMKVAQAPPVEAERVESASEDSAEALEPAGAERAADEGRQTAEPPVVEGPALGRKYVDTSLHEAEEQRTEHTEDERRTDQIDLATGFAGEEASKDETPAESSPAAAEGEVEAARDEAQPESAEGQRDHSFAASSSQTLEHEEIEDEDAELPLVAERLEDADDYEELEEETLDAHPIHAERNGDLAELGEELTEAVEEAESEGEAVEGYEGEEGGEEMEYEAGAAPEGEEETAGRAELRAPAGTAGYQQRTQPRPPFERRGRGRRGGRRIRQSRPMQSQQVMISDMLKEGQEIVVQIAKEPIGKKGARITSHIALPGRFLVYMPTVNHIGVSRKISSDDERQRLKRIVMGERDMPGHGGFIVRTAAENVAEDELRADIRFLKNLWSEIKTRADDSKAPALIYHDLNLVERTLRDQLTEDFTHVWVDNEQEYERVLRFVNRFQPNLVRRIRLYTKETPLFEQFGIQEEINKALKSKVWLKSGGYIVINQTEALVAIDVNTGKYVGKTMRLEDTIVKTNVDAIKEIVRQVRLRDLGGIIVIDFIDMDERKNRQKVMQALEEALKNDRAPSKVLQFNDFGLVAITRKRVKHSLERTLGTPCPYCTGTGLVKSVETVCNEIYTEMKKMRKHLDGHEVLLRVNPEVAKELKANNARWLNDLEELAGKSIIIKADASLHQEQFDM